jgi:hypothetical protein
MSFQKLLIAKVLPEVLPEVAPESVVVRQGYVAVIRGGGTAGTSSAKEYDPTSPGLLTGSLVMSTYLVSRLL